jgi:hypothetical protein
MYSKKDAGVQTSASYSSDSRGHMSGGFSPINTEFSTAAEGRSSVIVNIFPSPNIVAPSVSDISDSYGTNPNTQGLTPFDSSSQRAMLIGRSDSESSGITINIESPIRETSPISSIIESPPMIMPGGFPPSRTGGTTHSIQSAEPLKVLPRFNIEGIARLPLPDSPLVSQGGSAISADPLRVLPKFGVEGLARLPLPESSSSSEISTLSSVSSIGEPVLNTNNRFAPLSLNVSEPFSDTPV